MSPGQLNVILASACGAAVFLALLSGSTPLSPWQVAAALAGQATDHTLTIVWEIRLPRALAALSVGAALGLSGAALQGLLRNPLAEPGVLGVSASAALAVTSLLALDTAGVIPAAAAPLAAVGGALIATLLLAGAALRTSSIVTLILIGVGVSSLAGALMSLILNFAPNPFSLAEILNWMLGSVANRSLADLMLALPFLGAGAVLLLLARPGLTALALGEEAAQGLGLDLARQRLLVVAGTGLVTGAAVSLAGAIGFVGIVAPHLVRPLVRHDPAATLVPAALLAGLILVLSDILVRVLPSETELKLGVVAALLGAPVFIWIAARRRLAHD